MNHATDEILHVEVVDKREVGLKSPNMERLGLVRALQYMESQSVVVDEIVTDGSNTLKATLRMLVQHYVANYYFM